MRKVLIACMFAVFYQNAEAQNSLVNTQTLACTILAVYSANTQGKFEQFPDAPKNLFLVSPNNRFTVNRRTGLITGRHVDNEHMVVTVLDAGLKEGQALKIISRSADGNEAMYLSIALYEKGLKKPFILSELISMTGLCE